MENNNEIESFDFIESELTKEKLDKRYKHYENKVLKDAQISNRFSNKASIALIKMVLNDFDTVVGHTLGPMGGNNLILNPYGHPTAFSTKDGYESMVKIRYAETAANNIRDIAKEIANYMVNKVGDSTTSGYPILNTLYSKMIDLLENDPSFKNISPVGVMNILNEVQEYFKSEIFTNEKYSLFFDKLTDDQKIELLNRVATISANNDRQIAESVVQLFMNKLKSGEEGAVALTMNEGENDVIENISGFELTYGLYDQEFANQPDQMSLIFENPVFLTVNGPLMNTDIDTIDKVIQMICKGVINHRKNPDWTGRPLVIVADSFAANLVSHILAMKKGQLYMNPNTNTPETYDVSLMAMSHMQGAAEREKFYDFITLIGATVIDTQKNKLELGNLNDLNTMRSIIAKLGRADSYDATLYGAKIIGGKGDEEKIQERVKYIQKQIDSQHSNSSYGLDLTPIDVLRERMSAVQAKMSRIKIGGINLKEKRRRLTVYDDVVRAVQSSIKRFGCTLGGNIAVSWTLYNKERREPIVNNIVKSLIDKQKNIMSIPVEFIENKNPSQELAIISEIVDKILKVLGESFSSSYKKSFLNAYKKEEDVDFIYKKCMESEVPVNFNLINGELKGIDSKDVLNSSKLLVAGNTDYELMRVIFSVLEDFILTKNTITFYPLNMSFSDYLNALRKN